VQGTANFAEFDLDAGINAIDFHGLTRWGAGAVLEIRLTENLSVVALPMYLGKGAESEVVADVQVRVELGYVEVPVLAKYAFGSGNWRPFVSAGPSIGFRSKAELGLTDIEEVEDFFSRVAVKNRGFQVRAGVTFGL
jgi:hypothetical protein